MTITKKNFFRMFLCLTLIFATLVGTTSVAHAQIGDPGSDPWMDEDQSGHVPMYDTNLTPVKTMGRSGDLVLWYAFAVNDNGPAIKLKIQVRNLTQGKTYSYTIHQMQSIDEREYRPSIYVNKGDRLQIYFDICTEDGCTPPGYKRSAVIQYGYYFK